MRLDDKKTYDLISSGRTLGIFQLENERLGGSWSKKLKPENIDHIAALTALLRPGALSTGATESFCNRKNGLEPVSYDIPALEPILKDTYGVMCFQESAMEIAQEIAGFSGPKTDTLRKSIGKKDSKLMSELEDDFIEGCKKVGKVTEEQARAIFEDIRKSQAYSFNACISEDEVIHRANKIVQGKYKGSWGMPVGVMYKVKNDINYAKKNGHSDLYSKYKQNGYGMCLTMDYETNTIKPKAIKDIYYSGNREVFLITLESGKTIEVTENHKFPTSNGIKEVKDIDIKKDSLYVMLHWEKHKQKNYSYSGKTKDEIVYNQTGLEKIKSIKCVGLKDVYDVEVDDPSHNFVNGNNIVTCNSHSYEYGMITYETAYLKAHHPNEFFCSYLIHAKDKANTFEEIEGLIQDAKHFNIETLPPKLNALNIDFKIEKPGTIRYGLGHIKFVGESSIENLQDNTDAGNSWVDFVGWASKLGKRVYDSLVRSGSIDYFGLTRSRMIEELALIYGDKDRQKDDPAYRPLTKKEMPEFKEHWMTAGTGNLEDALKQLIDSGKCTKTRIPIIKKKIEYTKSAKDLKDSNAKRAMWEKLYLGLPLTCSASDDYKSSNHKRLFDLDEEIRPGLYPVCVVVDKFTKKSTKGGNSSYYILDLSDNSGIIKYVKVWANNYKKELRENCVCEMDIKIEYWNGKKQYNGQNIKVF